MVLPPIVRELYCRILDHGNAGVSRYYDALRRRGIEPVPDPSRGIVDLYAPNPVIVAGEIIQLMTADANRFCATLLASVTNPQMLLERAPAALVRDYASLDVARHILDSLRTAHPLTSLDAFLVEHEGTLQPAYIEWQTVGTYLTLGRWVVESVAAAWPEVKSYSHLSAWPNLSSEMLAERLKAIYLAGIEDDPRQGVVIDYLPHQQPTCREFYAIRELTGGLERGMGIIDPREIVRRGRAFCYRRDDHWVPIRRVYSRLVYSDIVQLESEASADQLRTIHRFFQEAEQLTWINHPLHFFYGSKADFTDFYQRNLSPFLPASWLITSEFIERQLAQRHAEDKLMGFVLKPTDLQSGKDVKLDPKVSELKPGWMLQRQIHPAACHATLHGPRTPEIRIMCLPDERGQLIAGLMFNRVKAPDVFLSNAGHTARLNIPGTGEGYGIVVYDQCALD